MRTGIYIRVSTNHQDYSAQEERLRSYAGEDAIEGVFADKISGATSSRKGLDEMLKACRSGKVRRVLVTKLDRLGRSLPHLAQLITEFDRLGVALVAIDQGIDTSLNSPAGRLQLNVLLSVAEFERSIIRERTVEGLERAKAAGVKLGRRKGSSRLLERERKARVWYENNPVSSARLGREFGVSKSTAHLWISKWRAGE